VHLHNTFPLLTPSVRRLYACRTRPSRWCDIHNYKLGCAKQLLP
jgi:hypothetical protein